MDSPNESHESLREKEERLRFAIEAAGISICEWLIPEDRVTWSENLDTLLGFPPGALINYATFLTRIHEADRERVKADLDRAIADCSRPHIEYRIIWPDGTVRWLAGTGRMYPGPTGQAVRMIACALDITARKEAEERIRKAHDEILLRLVNVQEDERRQIARGLHDRVGQDITALSLELKRLEGSTVSDADRLRLQGLQDTVTRIGRDLHELALELRPPALDELGLHAALSHYLAEWSARSRIVVEFDGTGTADERYPAAVETTIYRVVQEALTNIEKHSRASLAEVLIESRQGEIVIIVEDDGTGFDFDWDRIAQKRRLGLAHMRDRVRSVGGSLEIDSSPGTGTRIRARIPVSTEEKP
jgi:two-component system, NarL family, sensor histidine kinase UhpB